MLKEFCGHAWSLRTGCHARISRRCGKNSGRVLCSRLRTSSCGNGRRGWRLRSEAATAVQSAASIPASCRLEEIVEAGHRPANTEAGPAIGVRSAVAVNRVEELLRKLCDYFLCP